MDMKQVVIFLLLLVPVWACRMNKCYKEQELIEVAKRKLQSHYPQPQEPQEIPAADSPPSCPVELYQYQPRKEIRDRSVSPWRLVLVEMKDHFPSTYAEAQCLCTGCILIQGKNPPQESHDYNSRAVTQSRVFLKKERCDDGKTYSLKPVSVEVAVGCTCVTANGS